MRLVPLGILNLYKKDEVFLLGKYNDVYIMRYDTVREKLPSLGHGFYLYNFNRIPVEFENLFSIHFTVVKESYSDE
jgi:hypothetical protein